MAFTISSATASCSSFVPRRQPPFGAARPATTRSGAAVCRGLKENVAKLGPIDDVLKVRIPLLNWEVENKEGKKASVAIYTHLAKKHKNTLDKEAALEGLALYDEVVEDAKQRPGAHPNIDLLLRVVEQDVELALAVDRIKK